MRKILLYSFLSAVPCLAADQPRIVRFNLGDTKCKAIYSDGIARERITDGGRQIDVWAPVKRDKHIQEVLVGVVNFSDVEIDVNPDSMGGLSDDSPALVMKSIDADAKIAKENRKARRWAMLGAGLSGYAAGSNTNTGTIHNSDGSTSTVTYHDPSATRQANQDAANNHARINSNSSLESANLLRHSTVAKGDYALGRVYVEKPKDMPKHSQMAQFVVDLGDTIYIFPYLNGKVVTQ